MHTNAGYYGEGGRVGHVDFCVNGGKRQPYCSNTSSMYGLNMIYVLKILIKINNI